MPAKIEIFGVKELDDFFNKMRTADQRRLFIAAWRIASKPLISTTRQNIRARILRRSTSNSLYKSIGFVPMRSRGKSVFVSAKVGARKGGNNKGYHGHLFDAGTTNRQTRHGFKRGTMRGTGFFTDAFKQSETKLTSDTQNHMIAALDKLIQRNLKRQAKTII